MKVSQTAKAWTTLLLGAALQAVLFIPDDAPPWLRFAAVVVTAAGTYLIPNAVTPSQRAQVVAEQAASRGGTTYRPMPRHERGPDDPIE